MALKCCQVLVRKNRWLGISLHQIIYCFKKIIKHDDKESVYRIYYNKINAKAKNTNVTMFPHNLETTATDTYIHAYINTCIHTYIHIYLHTYITRIGLTTHSLMFEDDGGIKRTDVRWCINRESRGRTCIEPIHRWRTSVKRATPWIYTRHESVCACWEEGPARWCESERWKTNRDSS